MMPSVNDVLSGYKPYRTITDPENEVNDFLGGKYIWAKLCFLNSSIKAAVLSVCLSVRMYSAIPQPALH